jgi:hypothetical protein
MALEFEIATWKPYRKALPTDEDREAFDTVMDLCRGLASAGSNATNPILFEPMMVSAVVALQKKLIQLEYRLMDAIWRQVCKQQPLGDEAQAIKSEATT